MYCKLEIRNHRAIPLANHLWLAVKLCYFVPTAMIVRLYLRVRMFPNSPILGSPIKIPWQNQVFIHI